MIKLVATDMDGTFLDGAGQFDMERLKKLLHSIKKKESILLLHLVVGFCHLKSILRMSKMR